MFIDRVRPLLAGVFAAVVLAAAPASAGAIQPGDYHETDAGACTLSFVYDGGGAVYMGTAAHCVESVGQDVRLMNGQTFGDVALIGDQDDTAADYAFIQVRPAFVPLVSPAVAGSPTLPSGGPTVPSETASGDLIQLSGHGLGFGVTQPTREQRRAVLGSDDAELYDVSGPLIFGDSGGPLVHLPTGKALGIVSRLCVGICSEEGPTVQGILTKAAARGFNVTLRTVN